MSNELFSLDNNVSHFYFLGKPLQHRLSHYCAYTNWGFGYSLFSRFIKDDSFRNTKSLGFFLAKIFRWKRTYFYASRRFSISLEPSRWQQGPTILLHNNICPWSEV